jgi:hypothetical protein
VDREEIKKVCFNVMCMRLVFALLLAGILFLGFGCPSEEGGVKDCGTDFDCMIEAADSCSPAKMTDAREESMQGMSVFMEMLLEIKGTEDEKCVFSATLKSTSITFEEGMKEMMRSMGATEEGIVDEEKRANEVAQEAVGEESICRATTENLKKLLINWRDGDYYSANSQGLCEEEGPSGQEEEPEELPEEEINLTGIVCQDGTRAGECSPTKPKVCDVYGNLVDDAERCGCPENSVKRGSECIYSCEDGTPIGSCSIDQPFYCNSEAMLEEKVSACGCPPGYDVYGESCRNACEDGTSKYSCSTATPPYYCNEEYELVMNPLVCGCQSWEFLLEGKCFDPGAQEYSMGETIRVTETLSVRVDKMELEGCDDGTYMKVQLTVANAGKESVELNENSFKFFRDDERGELRRPTGCSIGHMFDWGTLRAGETESGQVWYRLARGPGDEYHIEYLHYYTQSVLKEFYINLEEDD